MSADEELTAIRSRLTKLERQGRRMRMSAVVLALCLVGTVAIGQAPADKPKTIEAQEFIVRDQQGRLRAKLATSTYGTVLSFHQGELPPGVIEQKTMELGVLGDHESAILVMNDAKSKAGVFMSVQSNVGGSVLVLRSADEAKRLELVATRDIGGPKLAMTSPAGMTRVTLDGEPDRPSLELKPLKGKSLKVQPE